MIRGLSLHALLLLLLCTTQSSAVDKAPPVPTSTGYCVVITDVAGNLIGVTEVPFHKPDAAKLDEFRGSLMSAINLVGRSSGRADVVQASGSVELIDNPMPPLRNPRPRVPPATRDSTRHSPGGGGGGCVSYCRCSSTMYGSKTILPEGGEPYTIEAIIGCGGSCGNCQHCVVICS